MRFCQPLLLSFLLFVLGATKVGYGCPSLSGDPTEPVPEPQLATVYIYRPWQLYGGALEPAVYCDEEKVAKMDNGRYFVLKLEPGVHTIRSTDKRVGLKMDFEAGKEYFVRIYLISTYYTIGKGRAWLESRDRGILALKELKPLKLRDVRDKQRVIVPSGTGD